MVHVMVWSVLYQAPAAGPESEMSGGAGVAVGVNVGVNVGVKVGVDVGGGELATSPSS